MKKTSKPTPKKNGQKPEARGQKKPSADAGTVAEPIRQEVIAFVETQLPLADIVPGYNARPEEEFTAEEQKELADSIAQIGIQTRLWVWRLPKPAKGGANYELIGGERRWRAAQVAGLLTAPVKIYDCSRKQALMLGLVDNLQRKQLREIDQALAYKKMVDEEGMKAWDEADQANSLGHRLRISKTKIYALLKLADLSPAGVKAVRAGELSASVGVRIARIPNAGTQKEALAAAMRCRWTDERAAAEIERHFMTELKGAPFDRKDEKLYAKRGSCEKCPLRTGNQRELYPDLVAGRGDICTDPTCYRRKCILSFEQRAKAHLEKGGRVLSEKEAQDAGLQEGYSSIGGRYTSLDHNAHDVDEYDKTWRKILAPALKSEELLPILALANDGSGKHFEILLRDEAKHWAGKLGYKATRNGGGGGNGVDAAHRQKREKAKVRTMHQLGAVAALGEAYAEKHQVFGAPIGDPAMAALRVIGEHLVRRAGADGIRLIAKRRSIDSKSFKLEGDLGATTAHERGLVEILKFFKEGFGLICELLACPGYIQDDGKITVAEPVAKLLGYDAEAAYTEAIRAVEYASKVGKTVGGKAEVKNGKAGLGERILADLKKLGAGSDAQSIADSIGSKQREVVNWLQANVSNPRLRFDPAGGLAAWHYVPEDTGPDWRLWEQLEGEEREELEFSFSEGKLELDKTQEFRKVGAEWEYRAIEEEEAELEEATV